MRARFPATPPLNKRGEHWWFADENHEVRLSNLDKVFFPDDGITKGDLIAYYFNIAPLLLPHLAHRPIAMKRTPEGIAHGPAFFEDAAPAWTPPWVTRCAIESEDGDVDALVVIDDVPSLLFAVNAGCIDLHPFHSRCENYDRPDWMVFDLDPEPPATFADAIVVARHVRVVLEQLGLSATAKTSGATGVQVYVGVAEHHSYDETRELARRIARIIMQADPDRVTMEWSVRARAGKVFIDHNMNRRAASLASVYSVRPRATAPVSTPLTWDEVDRGDVASHTIETIFDRVNTVGDLFEETLSQRLHLDDALAALNIPRTPPPVPARVRKLIAPA
jgi:bifunctional non-homologous end joining protein LigD